MSRIAEIRDIYKALTPLETHLIQSTEVATATVCAFLFRLSYPFGANFGSGIFQVRIALRQSTGPAEPKRPHAILGGSRTFPYLWSMSQASFLDEAPGRYRIGSEGR